MADRSAVSHLPGQHGVAIGGHGTLVVKAEVVAKLIAGTKEIELFKRDRVQALAASLREAAERYAREDSKN